MVDIDLDRLEQRCRAPAVFEEQQRAKERAAFDALPALIAEVRRLREALKEYAGCGDGCTCGDGWSHDTAIEALEASDAN